MTQRHEIFCRGYNEDFEISVRRFGEVGLIYNDLSFLELVPVFFRFWLFKNASFKATIVQVLWLSVRNLVGSSELRDMEVFDP